MHEARHLDVSILDTDVTHSPQGQAWSAIFLYDRRGRVISFMFMVVTMPCNAMTRTRISIA